MKPLPSSMIPPGLLKGFLDPSSSGFSAEGSSTDVSILLEIQADILLILSCLCEMDMHRKVCMYTHLRLNLEMYH